MSTITVKTQAELDKAIQDKVDTVIIDSPKGVWIYLSTSGSSTVEASGSSTVRAYDSSTVQASGSSTVEAYDSSTVEASGSSTVRASGSSTVEASGSSTVEAYDSSTVEAYDSSTVEAYGSSTVRAYDSSTVEASGSSTVRAYDSSTVRAYGSSTVEASKYVAVHLHTKTVHITGGVVIDVSDIDPHNTEEWIAYHGVTVEDGFATVYKAVDKNLEAGHKYTTTRYGIGETVTADDWKPTKACGNGLHFGYTPANAAANAISDVARYLEVRVPVDGLVALGDKVKSQTATVVREVDRWGDPV